MTERKYNRQMALVSIRVAARTDTHHTY